MPRRTAGVRLSSPPACSSLPLASVLASLALYHGALAIPYAGAKYTTSLSERGIAPGFMHHA
jgi:hypothetical protein